MRVIAGSLGGRNFSFPLNKRTHPMSQKLRGAIFGSLGDLSGLSVLDAYSGSGALAIEAVSRGAVAATAVESDRRNVSLLKSNLSELGVTEKVKVIGASVEAWLVTDSSRFDIIIADPPFHSLSVTALNTLASRLNTDGLLVVSWPGGQALPVLGKTKLIKAKRHGDAQAGFFLRV